jgi:hypothetical protein
MDRVICPQCGYIVGLGMACEPGLCPHCERPLVHTTEFRALTREDLEAEVERQLRLERERRDLPLA